MIAEMLKKENVQIVESVADWKDAIHVAVQPLVDSGYVEARYIDGIIENTYAMGPYYVLIDDVALLHARPEQGCIEKQLAVTIVHEPVHFAEDGSKDARLLVTLSATDGEGHIAVMGALASLFMDEEKIATLVKSNSVDEVYEIFMNASEE